MNGKNMKIIRKLRGYTQRSLAKAMGTTQVAISSWENEARNPTTPMVIKLANALNCSIDVLLQDVPLTQVDLGGKIDGR